MPGTQHDVDFMVKDSKRFADSGGWGWGAFEYDAASDTFSPATVADNPPQGNDRDSIRVVGSPPAVIVAEGIARPLY
jgi:Cytochrome P460